MISGMVSACVSVCVFVIDTILLYYTLTYLIFLIMLQLFVYFTLDGGFEELVNNYGIN
jgi:hypothetical protein